MWCRKMRRAESMYSEGHTHCRLRSAMRETERERETEIQTELQKIVVI